MTIHDVMTENPAFCAPSSSAQTAALVMQQKDTGILPVTADAFSRKLVGVVTDRDLCMAVLVRGRDPSHVWVQECMTRDLAACQPGEEVSAALRLMREHRVRRIPVVDEAGNLKGIVSLADLVRQRSISPAELFDTLEKICEPAPVKPSKPAVTLAA
ncbi:MAG TPA: CBS domain-containing protein [Terriglobales bacterium]|jgi:CBS domain-containing protein|nr:CBS domain-containing protein [Terriglobales bacterium]